MGASACSRNEQLWNGRFWRKARFNGDKYARLAAAAEAEKRALIEQLNRPSGKSEEEKIQLASTVIQRAVRNGLTEERTTI